jgi:NodT family efflux transporter outer membrane factor (OMF) lipoprotein
MKVRDGGMRALLASVGIVFGLSSCTLGPDYQRPTLTTPAAYKEAGAWQVAQPSAPTSGPWWHAYGDATLNRLVDSISVNNQNLAAAAASYRAATAAIVVARAAQLPSVTTDLQVTRSRGAQNSGNAVTAGAGSSARTLARLAGSANWEIDLWGRVRRSVEQARATAAASAADLAALELSLRGTLVSTYISLRVAQAERRLLEDNVSGLRRALEITRNRYRVGVAARLDVSQAETQLATTQAQAVDVGVRCATLEHALATLVGVAPADFTLDAGGELPPLPGIASELPSTLLERRPDIAAAERRVAAANAAIGIAQSAWFPTLSLGGSAGFQHSNLIDLVSLPYHFWSVGPALAGTLFDGGLRKGQKAQAVASYEQSVAQYRQTALAAFQEVEDQLATLRVLAEESVLQDAAATSAAESQRLAENQYKAGTVSYLNVVTAQTSALNAARSALDIRGRRLAASVALYQALGGDATPNSNLVPASSAVGPTAAGH